MDKIDENKLISHRLYRMHTVFEKGAYNKDLSILGRDLSRVLIIDNNSKNFQKQPENGIYIKPWFSDPEDSALRKLSQVLKTVAEKKPSDLRIELKNMLSARNGNVLN